MKEEIMEEVVVNERHGLRWGPIWGGLFVVAAVEIVMQLFGLAIGASALNPSRSAVQGVSIWTAIWAIISTWVAFFCGGWFAAGADERLLGRRDCVRAGVAVWGFALTIGMLVMAAGMVGAIDMARGLLSQPGAAQAGGGPVETMHSAYTIGAAWAAFGTLLIALACSIGGAMLGIPSALRRERPRRERRTVVVPPQVPSPTA
jgi:hypothetical protein